MEGSTHGGDEWWGRGGRADQGPDQAGLLAGGPLALFWMRRGCWGSLELERDPD